MSAVQKVQKHVTYIITYVKWLWRRYVSMSAVQKVNTFHYLVLVVSREKTEAREAAPIVRLPSRAGKHRQGEKLFIALDGSCNGHAIPPSLSRAAGRIWRMYSTRRHRSNEVRSARAISLDFTLLKRGVHLLIITVPMHKRIKYCLLKITFLAVKFAITPID